jgi:hypothetical protein
MDISFRQFLVNKTGNVLIIIIIRRIRVTIVAVKKRPSITHYECVSSLSYPPCKAHAPYYIAICGLPGSTVFFHIIS